MIVRIDTQVYLEVPDNADLNDVGAEFSLGYEGALSHFPGGDVISTDIEQVVKPDEAEIQEKGLVE